MKQFFITVAGVVVGFMLILLIPLILIIGAISAITMGSKDKHQPGDSQVIRIDLRQPMTDQPQDAFFEEGQSLLGLVDSLRRAEDDPKVKGVFIRANSYGMQPVHAEQIRLSIKRLQAAGKFVTVHAQGFEGTSVTSYLSVASADDLWLQDTASFSATGLATETPFYGGVFEKIKAKPEFEQFYEYKNAANSYTQKTFTDAHREATLSWASSIFDTAITQIAEDREMQADELRSLIEGAPYSAELAVESGLADQLGHVVEAREAALKKADDGEIVELADYDGPASKPVKGKTVPLVALVDGQGAIVTGEGNPSPFSSESAIYSDTMAEAIIAATADENVKAILIRVDSPGGSAIASDQIWNAIERAKAKDKKIIISMGQLAASGGYYIAAGADVIYAYPTTLTGSIGVLGGKIVLDDTFEMAGYNVEQLRVGGEFAGAYSGTKSFSETQRAAFRAGMADIYEDFTGKVAMGRDIPIEQVLEIAKGRVWTGEQAKEIGLVDELGGYRDAIAKTKELIGVEPEDKIRLMRFPEPKTQIEQFYDMFGISTEAAKTMTKLQVLTNSEQFQALVKAQQLTETGPAELEAPLPSIQ